MVQRTFLVFFIDRFVPQPHDGISWGPLIFIRPTARGDVGLLAHEQVHQRQFFRTLGLHPLFYKLSARYRLAAEAEAYREQLKYSGGDSERFAGFLATRYALSITHDEALKMLS